MKPFALIASATLLAGLTGCAQMNQDDVQTGAEVPGQNLCQLNLGEIDQYLTMASTIGEPAESRIRMYYQQAQQAQRSGNVQECIAHSGKALEIIRNTGEGAAPGITE